MTSSRIPASPPGAIEDACIAAGHWALWRTLARGLAHGLANAAQMLALDPIPPLAREEAIERVTIAMARLAEVGRSEDAGPTDLAERLADLQSLQRLQSGFPSTELMIECAAALPAAAIPAADLTHALLALVTRAKIAAGDAQAKVRLRAHPSASCVEIEVQDAGPAVSPALAARMFEPLGDAPEALGHGLAAARLLVRRAGGELALTGPSHFVLRLRAWRRPR